MATTRGRCALCSTQRTGQECGLDAADYLLQHNDNIGDELRMEKRIIPSDTTEQFAVLDLCMAPGGYSATVLKHCPSAQIRGISLPIENGGHRMRLNNWELDPRINVKFLDITMLSTEFGPPAPLPDDYLHLAACLDERPFLNFSFDLVFCDGQVLWSHEPMSRSQREWKATRLTTSQLILAL